MRKSLFVAWLLIIGQLLGLVSNSVALAQTSRAIDDKFPVIEHNENPVTPAEAFMFRVSVTDNSAVASVTFLYRYSDESEFRGLVMSAASDGKTYSALLPKNERRDGTIKYYFVAEDDRGNTSTEGFLFDTLSRDVTTGSKLTTTAPAVSASNESVTDKAIVQPSAPAETISKPVKSGGIKPWQIVLGVLGVVALGALASSGGDSGGGDSSGNTTGTTTLIIPLP